MKLAFEAPEVEATPEVGTPAAAAAAEMTLEPSLREDDDDMNELIDNSL